MRGEMTDRLEELPKKEKEMANIAAARKTRRLLSMALQRKCSKGDSCSFRHDEN